MEWAHKKCKVRASKVEITEYVSRNPDALRLISQIIFKHSEDEESWTTSRKVGFFIPRYLKNIVDSNLTVQPARESTA